MSRYFEHEKLIAYQQARDVARWIRYDARFPRGEAQLRDQAKRAADSVVLNLAEGCCRDGKDRLYHFRPPLANNLKPTLDGGQRAAKVMGNLRDHVTHR